MKLVHNIRIRIIDRSRSDIELAFAHLLAQAAIKEEDVKISMSDDGEPEDPLFLGELWMDRQQPVRKTLVYILSKLSESDKEQVAQHPEKYIDTQTHCFIKLSKQAFYDDKYELTTEPTSVNVRINLAAFPATKEKAVNVLRTLFAKQ